LIIVAFSSANIAYGLSPEQKKVMDSGVLYFDVASNSGGVCVANPATTSEPGPLYLVGDSIGTQIPTSLTSALSAKNWTLKTNALSSRNISGIPPSPDGLGAIDQDSDFIKTTKAIVIELGTNSGGFSASTVGQMIDKIRSINPNAQIYWIDTVVVERQDYALTLNNVNSIIYAQASQKGYKVISWNKKVFGDNSDPTNINPSAPDNGYIRHSDQFVHLTPTGIDAMSSLITESITVGESSGCGCSTDLVGGENVEKIWNFIVNKGLTPLQTAGIMGNMQAEAHFEPRLVEYGWLNSRGEKSRAGQPSSLDDVVPPNQGPQGQPGYGLVQWTSPGRKQGLRDISAQRSIIAGDLGLQLDYFWQELTTGYKSVYDRLVASQTLEEATYLILEHYEVPADIAGNKPVRLGFANEILTKYGSGTPGSTVPPATGCQ